MDTEIHVSPCGLSLLQMVSFKLVSVTVLMWNISHRLVWLNIWFWEVVDPFGARLYIEEISLGWAFKVYSPDVLPTLSLLPGLWRHEPGAWSSCCHRLSLLPLPCLPAVVNCTFKLWIRTHPSSLLCSWSQPWANGCTVRFIHCSLLLGARVLHHMRGSKGGAREQEWEWEQFSSFSLNLGHGNR